MKGNRRGVGTKEKFNFIGNDQFPLKKKKTLKAFIAEG